jgi:hypothetical protein
LKRRRRKIRIRTRIRGWGFGFGLKEGSKSKTIKKKQYAAPLLLLSIAGHVMSPIYRNLTVQFKVFLLMSGMVVGGAIEGDRRLREYETIMRIRKREWEREKARERERGL